MRILGIVFLSSILGLSGCVQKQSTDTLSDIEKLRAPQQKLSRKPQGVSHIRAQALRDTAMSVSARSALALRSNALNQSLEKQDRDLNQVFNFYPMMLEHNVLPPVLVEGRDTLNLANAETIRISDRTYKIVKQARFVTTAPNWREYLWMEYQKPDVPNGTLLPKNGDERAIWDKAAKTGWDQGMRQAETIFAENLARLKRDYAGMVLYRKLLAQKMVSPPFVAKTELGVTGGGSDMRVNDQVLRITALPQLRADSKNWQAVPVKR